MAKEIKILTYNIHKGFAVAKTRFVLPKIRDALEDVDSDLVFLQEIRGEHNRELQPQFKFLAENNWPHFIYGKNALYKRSHHGNAILSKFPFLAWENVDVSKYKRSSRSLLHGVFKMAKMRRKIHVICIHFALFKTERNKQLQLLKTRIMEYVPENAPLIIAGDFNDWRSHAESFLERELKLKEAFKEMYGEHAKSFPAWQPKLQVDRIYYRNLKLLQCHSLSESPWPMLSDHLPLYAKFSC